MQSRSIIYSISHRVKNTLLESEKILRTSSGCGNAKRGTVVLGFYLDSDSLAEDPEVGTKTEHGVAFHDDEE